MTKLDQDFMKSAGITPEELTLPNWQTWREEDIDRANRRLRAANSVIDFKNTVIDAVTKDRNMWRLAAFAGWTLAVLFGIIGSHGS